MYADDLLDLLKAVLVYSYCAPDKIQNFTEDKAPGLELGICTK
jgi:hypothetical protein